MFSYWSYQGVPYNAGKEEDGEWRDNSLTGKPLV
jgi:hypothetical protein